MWRGYLINFAKCTIGSYKDFFWGGFSDVSGGRFPVASISFCPYSEGICSADFRRGVMG